MTPDKRKYNIGVVGDVSALLPFWEMMQDQVSGPALDTLGLTAAALTGSEVDFSAGMLANMGIPIYADFREMLSAHPDINLVIEAANQPSLLAELRSELPPGIILLERAAASFFIQLMDQDQMGLACRIDRQNTLNMLTTIIDQMVDEILFLDADGRVLNCNKAACFRWGGAKRTVIGKRVDQALGEATLIREGDSSPDGDPFEHTRRTGKPSEAVVSEVGDDGLARYYRVYTYPILDMARLSHIVLIRRDITRRTQMENRLQQSEKLASIGELSAYLAHEIRNPLMAISGFANSLLRTAQMDDPSREKLGIILTESKRLDAILKSVSNFARPMDAKSEEVDVNLVASTTMDVMGIGSDQHGIDIRLELQERLAKAKADPELITQCLINLVKNAMEALSLDGRGGGRLTVRTALKGRRVLLEVEDNGPGIPTKVRDQVFSPFFSTKGKGAGLGLAMVRKIMDQIGGDVKLTTREGKGTKVSLLLPPALAVAESGPEG